MTPGRTVCSIYELVGLECSWYTAWPGIQYKGRVVEVTGPNTVKVKRENGDERELPVMGKMIGFYDDEGWVFLAER